MYAVAGFHNDFFMLVPSTAAIALLLARRDRSAGAVLMLAVAVKFTAVLLLPFLLFAVRTNAAAHAGADRRGARRDPARRDQYLALFGFTIPNLSDQSTLLTTSACPTSSATWSSASAAARRRCCGWPTSRWSSRVR